jgi:hypothetical protein
MSLTQRLVKMFVSKETAAAMEAESRQWKLRCPNCAYTRSVWELGGIRYKASGNPRTLLTCPQCGQRRWYAVTKDPAPQ